MRCDVVVGTISVIGIVLPTTAGVPVTAGVALEVPLGFVTEGIGAGTAGVVVIGAVYDALVAIIGLVLRARRRAKKPIRRDVVVVFITVGVVTVLLTTGVIGVAGVAGGVSADAVAANAIPSTAANKNRFIEASS